MRFHPGFILLSIISLFAIPAGATSCRRMAYDREDGQRMFGSSERVFVGDLVQTHDIAPMDHPATTDAKLEVMVDMGDPPTVAGYFRQVESFKGAIDPQPIRVNATLVPGRRYLVFARKDGDELRADAGCVSYALPLSATDPLNGKARALLDWLRALPPAGGGGELNIYLRDENQHAMSKELRIESPTRSFSLRTDEQGHGRLDAIPEGSYRLTTVAPDGYRYACIADCTEFVVHDRGLDEYALHLLPRASLRVQVVDASGRPAMLRAQFDLFREDGTRVRALGSSASWYEIAGDSRDADRGFLVPGRYRLAIALPRFSPGRLPATTAITHHFDSGSGSVGVDTPILTVHDGDNVAQFRLPLALQPARVRLHFSGDPVYPALRRIGVHLLVGRENGAYGEDALYDTAAIDDDTGDATLQVVPGQTLRYSLPGYDIDGERDMRTLAPLADSVIDLHVRRR